MKLYIKQHKNPELIFLSETWLKEHDTKFFSIDNYKVYYDCREHGRGGGSALYVRCDIDHEQLIIQVPEKIYVTSVHLRKYNLDIYSIYRVPKNEFKTFDLFLENLLLNKNCVIVGDINLNIIEKSRKIKKYKDTINLTGYIIQNNCKKKFKITRRSK